MISETFHIIWERSPDWAKAPFLLRRIAPACGWPTLSAGEIAEHGADTGVHGFTYSTDLYNKYEEYETQIENALDELGYTMSSIFAEKEFETLQQYKEWACWAFLEIEAVRITEY